MMSLSPLRPHQASSAEFLAFIIAYMELLLARWECIDRGRHPGLKAVTLARFQELGIKDEILLWMLFHDHVEHLKLVPNRTLLPLSLGGRGAGMRGTKKGRRPASRNHTNPKRERGTDSGSRCKNYPPCKPAHSLTLTDQSCFALNDKGAVFADAFLADALLPQFEGAFEDAWQKLIMGLLTPTYDREQRLFTWGEHILKRFRQPAVNQELVLISAEELDWPEWFDDPMPRKNGHNPKTLLHDTIKDLNRRQAEWLVHFKGDGSGRRIGWELR